MGRINPLSMQNITTNHPKQTHRVLLHGQSVHKVLVVHAHPQTGVATHLALWGLELLGDQLDHRTVEREGREELSDKTRCRKNNSKNILRFICAVMYIKKTNCSSIECTPPSVKHILTKHNTHTAHLFPLPLGPTMHTRLCMSRPKLSPLNSQGSEGEYWKFTSRTWEKHRNTEIEYHNHIFYDLTPRLILDTDSSQKHNITLSAVN